MTATLPNARVLRDNHVDGIPGRVIAQWPRGPSTSQTLQPFISVEWKILEWDAKSLTNDQTNKSYCYYKIDRSILAAQINARSLWPLLICAPTIVSLIEKPPWVKMLKKVSTSECCHFLSSYFFCYPLFRRKCSTVYTCTRKCTRWISMGLKGADIL